MATQTLFRELARDVGELTALDSFEAALSLGKEDLHHDVLGCLDCRVGYFCPRSKHNRDHPYHECPMLLVCCE